MCSACLPFELMSKTPRQCQLQLWRQQTDRHTLLSLLPHAQSTSLPNPAALTGKCHLNVWMPGSDVPWRAYEGNTYLCGCRWKRILGSGTSLRLPPVRPRVLPTWLPAPTT